MTSNFLTRPFDITKYGVVVAGAQKNVGVAALAVVIVREDLIKPMEVCPAVLDFKITADNKSLYNTPPTYPIYITGLFLKWIKENGGLEGMSRLADARSKLIYDAIDNSNGFYVNKVNVKDRSRISVVFRIAGDRGEELEKKFIAEATAAKMIQLKGHRSVGGIRASMYNAITIEEAQVLERFMKDFQAKHQ